MTKSVRILTAILITIALGCMFAYQDVKKDGVDYQQHPAVVILTDFFCGSITGCIYYIGTGFIQWWKNRKSRQTANNKFYDDVARELQEKPMVPGLWTKAFSEMGGDDAKARAIYIKYRVAQMAQETEDKLRKHEETLRKQKKKQAQRAATQVFKSEVAKHFFCLCWGVLAILLGLAILILLIATCVAPDTAGKIGCGFGFLLCVVFFYFSMNKALD